MWDPTWTKLLLGGLLMGFSSSVLLYMLGRVAGVSAIIGGCFVVKKGDMLWRLYFLLGLVVGGLIFYTQSWSFGGNQLVLTVGHFPDMMIGGILVGFGSRLGGGCTSGHGVCGLPRGSRRSWMATFIFISSAMVTIFFKKLWGI
jgi:uncharacterized membrane protein YedE/YeeE